MSKATDQFSFKSRLPFNQKHQGPVDRLQKFDFLRRFRSIGNLDVESRQTGCGMTLICHKRYGRVQTILIKCTLFCPELMIINDFHKVLDNFTENASFFLMFIKKGKKKKKKKKKKSRECQNHNPQPTPETKGKRKRCKVTHIDKQNARKAYRPALSSSSEVITMLNRTEKR